MADTYNEIYAQTYGRNIMQLAQQKYSKTFPTVYRKPVDGKVFYQDRIGQWSMSLKAGRASATPQNDPGFSRRMGTMLDYNDARLLDVEDDLKIISDPKSAMTTAAGASLGRKIDDVNFAAAIGTSYSGETGSSAVVLPSAQKIANTSTGMTFAKLNQANRIFNTNDVEMEDRYLFVSPQGIEDMLAEEKLTSADYVTLKAIQSGNMGSLMGFNIIMSTRLAVAASVRSCIAWQKNGMCLGEATSPKIRTDEREDLSYAWQVYYSLHIGAVRLEEERVVQIDILES